MVYESNSLTKKTGNLARASRPAETPIRVVFSADQVNSWLPMEPVIEKGGRRGSELAFGAGRLGRDQRIDGCGAPRHIVACIMTC
jgi:hypothetical protein